jgi:conjugal transfer pilus assembly protein TraI
LELRLVCKPGDVAPTRSAAKPAPAAPPGTQFSLIDSLPPSDARESPEEVPSPARPEATPPIPAATLPPDPAPAAAPPLPTFSLKAPLRLNPAVRDALNSVVATLNGPGAAAAACAVASGLFVPLHELERRGIQPAVAIRALSDVRMLVYPDRDRPPTVSQDFGGDMTVGLVIDPRCVHGFDLAAFDLPDQAGG